ncbi:hypothetical protein ACFLU6_09885 [Acidobacteriota bacterium]
MNIPALALFTRSLRMDSRSRQGYLLRLALVGIILIYLIYFHSSFVRFGAPGRTFFIAIVWINLVFVTLSGLGLFSAVITEEKEEMTLGLLKMTALSPPALLLGKSGSRLLSVVLIILAQFPFVLLGVTLGGVSTLQIIAVYCSILAWTVLLCGVALFCSVLTNRTTRAMSLTVFILVLFIAGATAGPHILDEIVDAGWIAVRHPMIIAAKALCGWLYAALPFSRIETILTTGFAGSPVEFQVISNVIGGVLFFFLAWAVFEPCTREIKDTSPARDILLARTIRKRRAVVGRTWKWALTWKEFHFVEGGRRFMIIKVLLFAAFSAIMVYFSARSRSGLDLEEVGVGIMIFAIAAAYVELTFFMGRSLYEEARWRTFPDIMVLPVHAHTILWRKLAAGLIHTLPAAVFFWIGAALAPMEFIGGFGAALSTKAGLVFIAEAIYFVFFIAFFALVFKRAAFVLTFLIYLMSKWLIAPTLTILTFVGGKNLDDEFVLALFVLWKMGMIFLLYIGIIWRMRKLAAA